MLPRYGMGVAPRDRATGVGYRPSAAPSGLRGSDAPAWWSATPAASRTTVMIWAQPTATGSKALIARTR